MVCQVCQTRILDGGKATESRVHHSTYLSLKCSIDEGCYICTRLWANMHPCERILVLNALENESGYESPDDFDLPASELRNATNAEGIATVFLITTAQDSSYYTLYIGFRASTNTGVYSYCTLKMKCPDGK